MMTSASSYFSSEHQNYLLPAGSLIVILVWVYYTSAILYFGAEFTQVYSECYGGKIKPASYAVHIIQTEEEKTVKVLPPHEHEVEKK